MKNKLGTREPIHHEIKICTVGFPAPNEVYMRIVTTDSKNYAFDIRSKSQLWSLIYSLTKGYQDWDDRFKSYMEQIKGQ